MPEDGQCARKSVRRPVHAREVTIILQKRRRSFRVLVLLRRGLGALFEGTVHLLEAALRVGLEATGKQRDEQTLERFSLDETNTVFI